MAEFRAAVAFVWGLAMHWMRALSVVLCSPLVLAGDANGQAAASSPLAAPPELSASDWSGIRAAYEAGRHAAFGVDGGYAARNPGQGWLTCFDGRGFSTQPDAGSWTWGLQLERYGFAGAERAVSEPTQVSAAGQHVAYDWDATLQEWYVNDERGLEHGYTLRQRPPQHPLGKGQPLTITLALRGGLTPRLQADGRGVSFVTTDGATALTYAGLAVFDADGCELAARFEPVAEGLLLSIDERGARYPLTIDPVAQQAYLKASNTQAMDGFGSAVAVSGNTVVVGASIEASSAAGVNGDQSDNSALGAGAVYVFTRNGATWSQQAYLKASNPEASDNFGSSLSMSGDTLVVGAPGEDSLDDGVNGDQSNNLALSAGAAYVFVRSGTTWSQQAYLKASNPQGNDWFGTVLAISGDTVVVGASREASNATGVNGNQHNNSAPLAGAAYVFARSGTSWSQQAYLKASNTGMDDEFGCSVSVSGNTVVVGAFFERSDATGVNGDQSDNDAPGAGAAYVFVRSGMSWSQQAYLKASNTEVGDWFGFSVSASTDTIVVGAANEASGATGVNGDQSDNREPDAGAAYVFVRSGTSWSQQAYIKASNTGAGDNFGVASALSGDVLVVAASDEASNATGVNGDQSNNSTTFAGAAYAFARSGTSWNQVAYLKASNTGGSDHFGFQLAVSGDIVVIGADQEDSNATGVNGDQSNNGAQSAGAAYVYDLDLDPWTDLGMGLAGVSAVPLLAGTGPLSPSSSNQLALSNANPSSPATLVFGLSQLNAPFKGGTLVPFPTLLVPLVTNASGALTLPFSWPGSVPAGIELYLQIWIIDPSAVAGFSASNGLLGISG